MSKSESVGPLKVITMQYSLTNAGGVVVREATGTPVSYLHGASLLFPKRESELETHIAGDVVEPGGNITGQDEDGEPVTFTLTTIENGIVSLDGNHAFAGQSLVFEVEIQGIRDATEEGLRLRKVLV
jgi:FKBP-type peptidyl-prolyl cis-trans isomerase SlyD